MATHHGLSARRADRTLGLSRSARHYQPRPRDDRPLIEVIESHLKDNPGHGFGLLSDQALYPKGFGKTLVLCPTDRCARWRLTGFLGSAAWSLKLNDHPPRLETITRQRKEPLLSPINVISLGLRPDIFLRYQALREREACSTRRASRLICSGASRFFCRRGDPSE